MSVTATHPLDRLSAEEISANRTVLDKSGLIGPSTRFALVLPDEPPKTEVLAWRPGTAWDRKVRAVLLDRATGAVEEVVVSLSTEEVVERRTVDVTREGQPPILGEEFGLVEEILWGDDAWCAAMARRGLEDPRPDPGLRVERRRLRHSR